VKEAGKSTGSRPSVCPFVALAEDRNRRGDDPDKGNRCYAEPAPRQRDLAYQHEYCYSADFADCSVFLAWAARNAAEPTYVTEAAQKAWAAGIASPEDQPGSTTQAAARDGSTESASEPTPEGGLFGPPDDDESPEAGSTQLDWVSASAWADAPWDERAEAEAEEIAEIEAQRVAEEEPEDEPEEPDEQEEATTGPKVPAALPMRRRRRAQRPIRSRGSGEWFYADPLDHEPLVKRRYGLTPPILLGVLGLLVVALFVFLLPSLLSGGDDAQVAAVPSASPMSSNGPAVTRAPVVLRTAAPTVSPSPTPLGRIRNYRIKSGDTLTRIAERFNVRPAHIQCLNGMANRNIVLLGLRYKIPPEGFTCWPGWKTGATPPPDHVATEILN
jgi:LysM repeat protein